MPLSSDEENFKKKKEDPLGEHKYCKVNFRILLSKLCRKAKRAPLLQQKESGVDEASILLTPILKKRKIRKRDWIEKYAATSIYRRTASENVKVSEVSRTQSLVHNMISYVIFSIPIDISEMLVSM